MAMDNGSKRPVYEAIKVAELPEDVRQPRKGPRTDPKLRHALDTAKAEPGAWFCIGQYVAENGAKTKEKAIAAKKIKLPDGRWEMTTRVVERPDGSRGSNLYAKFVG